MRVKRARSIGVALGLTAVLVAAGACGDDDDSDSAESGSTAPAPTGPAIDLGFLNVENSPAGSYPDHRLGAEAAVEYVNRELGGVNGRPLRLESCIADGSGERSIACANQFVQGSKVAAVPGLDLGADAAIPILAEAGIPYVGGLPTSTLGFTSPISFAFVGGSAGTVMALSRYVGEELQAKKVSIITVDVPAATLAIDQFAKPILQKLGTTDVSVIAESATAADFTPAVTKANEGDPDAIMVMLGGVACSKIMQATNTLGIDPTTTLYSLTCNSPDQLEAGGAGAQGVRLTSPYLTTSSDDPEVVTYRAAMESYSPEASLGNDSQSGFNSILNLYALMKTMNPGEITAASVTAALQAARDQPNFMAHPYSCDGLQVPVLSSLCNANERIVRYQDGKFTDVVGDWINGAQVLAGAP